MNKKPTKKPVKPTKEKSSPEVKIKIKVKAKSPEAAKNLIKKAMR